MARLGIANICCQTLSGKRNDIPTTYIVPVMVFIAVVLSTLVNNFQIWKDLVISSTISIKALANKKANVKEPTDAEKPVIIYYKYQY